MHGEGLVESYSSGSRPSGAVNPKAIASMKEIRYDLSLHKSIGLDEVPDVDYDYAITMGGGDECPMIRSRNREDWEIADPKHMDPEEFAKVRDLIESKVKELLSRL
jgi:protein-tyrosine-phosphatase